MASSKTPRSRRQIKKNKMLEMNQRRTVMNPEARTSIQQPRKLVLALVILVVALVAVLVGPRLLVRLRAGHDRVRHAGVPDRFAERAPGDDSGPDSPRS